MVKFAGCAHFFSAIRDAEWEQNRALAVWLAGNPAKSGCSRQSGLPRRVIRSVIECQRTSPLSGTEAGLGSRRRNSKPSRAADARSLRRRRRGALFWARSSDPDHARDLASFVLAPVVNLFRRLRLGRVASVLFAVLISLAVVLALGGIVGTELAGVASDVPRYQTNIQEKAHTLRGLTIERFSSLVGKVTREVSEASKPAVETQKEAPTSSPDQSQGRPPLPVEIHQPPPSPLDLARSIISPILAPSRLRRIVLIVAIFVLFGHVRAIR